ncbi:GIY-YIG nuclease family protein [uncultured Ilyobacter sp.]|uniref:GIY-YIG nuclease family protein n=1 Tax=uncultured Ilyobacter sp. TaxID=544433 RepID=UPI0029C99344|nr:GIY-YIG nuclease family protein [uncultured Ilyobacter sp.]
MKMENLNFKKIEGYNFKFICKINPEITDGVVKEYFLEDEFTNLEKKKMNPYGKEKFCKFRIPSVKSVGVYCIMENDRVVYIGECLNLEQRFNSGYGVISPKNCFERFQTVNCKINSLILRSSKEKSKLELYFIKSSNRKKLKKELQSILRPSWNEKKVVFGSNKISEPSKDSGRDGVDEMENKESSHGKYKKIFRHLKNMKAESIEMSLIELEKILGFKLPKSALSYTAWWSNGGHPHSKTWMDAGYKVKIVTLGEKICFYKI